MTTTTTRSADIPKGSTSSETEHTVLDRARGVVDTAADKAGNIADRASKATAELERSMTGRTDARLRLITTASMAFAAGLFAGGAPRLFVLAALAPAGLAGAVLLDRAEDTSAAV